MTTFIVKHQVANFTNWLPVFEGHQSFRMQHGEKSENVYRENDHPNNVVIMFEWESKEKAEAFSNTPELKEAMIKGGVMGPPTVYFIE